MFQTDVDLHSPPQYAFKKIQMFNTIKCSYFHFQTYIHERII